MNEQESVDRVMELSTKVLNEIKHFWSIDKEELKDVKWFVTINAEALSCVIAEIVFISFKRESKTNNRYEYIDYICRHSKTILEEILDKQKNEVIKNGN